MQSMWLPMELNVSMVLIVVAGVFLAGFMDGIAGGGGIIPASVASWNVRAISGSSSS